MSNLKLINYSELSRVVTGKVGNITPQKTPDKYEKHLHLLDVLIDTWKKQIEGL